MARALLAVLALLLAFEQLALEADVDNSREENTDIESGAANNPDDVKPDNAK